jgi:hypothetical protein
MDPVFELKAAIISRLKADVGVTATIAASRIYDRHPDVKNATSPYISFGPADAVTDDAECIEGQEITFQIDVWSWGANEAFGTAEAMKIAGAVKKALHEAEIVLAVNALATLTHRITRYQRDSDGATNRAIISITAMVESA